ncbi:hypothetical protein ACFWWS_40065, partial [Streptomyces sp. NPDC059083]|uniref:hypothetical protein n=1 Tax=Streptomyces sp. NPDC059083 TaxID=3346721 RepID=UPI0036898AFD
TTMRHEGLRMKHIARAAVLSGIAAAAMGLGAGPANAGETGTIIGRNACEETAKMYREMGYSARCNHIHDERYYVSYDKPRPGWRGVQLTR